MNIIRITMLCRCGRFFETEYNPAFDEDCPICCDKLKEPMMETTCHNMFCTNCILTWLESNRTCPLCRNNICVSNLIHIKSETHEQEEKETFIKNELKLTKFEHISNILKEDNNSKILLFSCHNSTFGNIKNFMQNDNILFKELKGSIHSIENTISDFKNGKIKVLFLNSNYSGSGINFQECTDIIIFHDMSEDLKKQIIGRANRIGRTIPLKVHYLF
jgi:SNF2 family DNA or RNA helicase